MALGELCNRAQCTEAVQSHLQVPPNEVAREGMSGRSL